MKIFHVAGGGDRGGAKTHILALCSRLKERFDLTLISLRSGDFPESARMPGSRHPHSSLGLSLTIITG